jgi:2-polyprenyl-3-methyl-5-hydroxy-6-metoxy-1,4-benzoquinol methylase/glycosyltransferase involved in cell wall biosynthesis
MEVEDLKNRRPEGDDRAGIGMGIITRGTVSIKWMTHMDKLKSFYPIGMFWKYIIVEGTEGWAKNRIEVVKRAQKEKFEWLFFVDDDVFIPKDGVREMIGHDKDIVTGVYWAKTDKETPVIFEKHGAGPMYKFPVDKLFKVAGSGLGCCLINMKVFDAFDKAGIPYFKENWIMELDDGRKMKCPIGEDHYFFYHARKLGFDIWADGGVLCDHYDMNKKRFYPSQEVVKRISTNALKQYGREDIIEEQDKRMGLDPDKKSIVFVNLAENPFSGDELERRGLGGAETDIINLSNIFANDYKFNVHVFCSCPRPGIYDNVVYHDLRISKNLIKEIAPDLLILSRNAKVLNSVDFKKEYNAKKVCLWTHDIPQDPIWTGFDKSYKNIDKIFALTQWHKKAIMKYYPFIDEKKMFVARNGVDMNRYKDRDKIKKVPGRLIYSSTPYRGLDILAKVFPEIKKRVPEAHLKVFSSMNVYGRAYDLIEEEYRRLYERLKNMDGVEYSASVTQKELAIEQMKAMVLAYPNTFEETCCVTALECEAAGTPIVTSDLAALCETVPEDVGIKISGNPHGKEYQEKFINAVVELLTNQEKWETMHKACLTKDNSWATITEEWINEFFPEQSKTGYKKEEKSRPYPEVKDPDSILQHGNINTPEYWDSVHQREIDKKIHRFNKQRSIEILKEIKENDKVLDIGCSTGNFTRYVKNAYPNTEVWGSDFSTVAIDFCRQHAKNIFYANHPMLNDDFEKNYFDVITMQHVLEHLEKPEEMIARGKELLKKGGLLMISMPINDDEWHEHLKIWSFEDVENLVNKFKCDYYIKTNKTGVTKKNGEQMYEANVYIRFKEDEK